MGSDQTYQYLDESDGFQIRYIDRVQVKGQQDYLSVYEVYNQNETQRRKTKEQINPTYQTALEDYNNQNWTEASEGFKTCMQSLPDDFVLQLYYRRCSEKEKQAS